MDIREILTRKLGPAPVWVYAAIAILGGAWLLRRNAAKKQAAEEQTANSDVTAGGVVDQYAMAYPMPYQSDVFVNVQNPPAPITINNPGAVVNPPTFKAPLPAPNPVAPAPPPRVQSVNYVVQRGDTLWSIAAKILGSGAKNQVIYQANKATIEAVARQHGYSSSQSGHWIFPGEKLVIPK